jgi:hypothetical protein
MRSRLWLRAVAASVGEGLIEQRSVAFDVVGDEMSVDAQGEGGALVADWSACA